MIPLVLLVTVPAEDTDIGAQLDAVIMTATFELRLERLVLVAITVLVDVATTVGAIDAVVVIGCTTLGTVAAAIVVDGICTGG